VPAGVKSQVIEQIVQYLWAYHDALRTRFAQTETGWQQIIPAPDENTPAPFSCLDFSKLPTSECTEAIERAADELQRSLDILNGPLMRVAFFDLGEERPGRLFFVLHHLIYDAGSSIFFDDFYTLSQQISRSETMQLPPKTTPIGQWLERLNTYTRSAKLRQELGYWLSFPSTEFHSLPLDYPENRDKNTWGSGHSFPARLSLDETEILLREIPKAYGVQVIDVLIAALVESITKSSNCPRFKFSMIDFGRNAIPNTADLDLSRTMGWFSMESHLVLQRNDPHQPLEALKSIALQLKNIPHRGLGYELLLYGTDDPQTIEKLLQLPKSEVLFNYAGRQTDNLNIGDAYEYAGPAYEPRNQRPYLLDCSALILDGRLVTNWRYSRNLHKRATIKKMAEDYIQWLQALIAQFTSSRYTG